jgi:hypothetical protein
MGNSQILLVFQVTSLSSAANHFSREPPAFGTQIAFKYGGQQQRPEACCGDLPVGLSILFSHRRGDHPGRAKDVDRSYCFGRQQSHRLCDRVAHFAVRLYPCECVLHLHQRIQSSGMDKSAERSIRIDDRLQTNEHRKKRSHISCRQKYRGTPAMTASTANQDVLGLKHAFQLGVGITLIVMTVVLAWQ